jgi:hypothetical protein
MAAAAKQRPRVMDMTDMGALLEIGMAGAMMRAVWVSLLKLSRN